MARKEIQFANFYAGLSDDPYLGPDGTFQNSGNIEVRRNPRFAHLTNAPTTWQWNGAISTPPRVNHIIDLYPYQSLGAISTGQILLCSDGVYYYGGGGIVKLTGAITANYTGGAIFPIGGVYYLIYIGNNILYKTQLNTITATTLGSQVIVGATANSGQLSNNTLTYTFGISAGTSYGGDIYTGTGTKADGSSTTVTFIFIGGPSTSSSSALIEGGNSSPAIPSGTLTKVSGSGSPTISYTGVTVSNYPTFVPMFNYQDASLVIGFGNVGYTVVNGSLFQWTQMKAEESIVGFTYFADQIKVYTNTLNIGGGQYFYKVGTLNLSSQIPSYYCAWNGTPIYSVTNFGNLDYVVAGNYNSSSVDYTSLWTTNGYQRNKLHQGGAELGNNRMLFSKEANIICERNSIIYLGAIDGLYSFGSEIPAIQQSIFREQTSDNVGSYPTFVGKIQNTMVIAKNDGNGSVVYQIGLDDTYSSGFPNTTGFITSKTFTGGLVSVLKQVQEIEFGYNIPNTDSFGSIIIQLSINGGTFTTIKTLGYGGDVTNFVYGQDARYRITNAEIPSGLRYFNTISMNVILNQGGYGSYTSPIFYDALITYDDNVQR